eukprot:gene27352-33038_t
MLEQQLILALFLYVCFIVRDVSSTLSSKPLRILVLGGTGFVGSKFIAKAASRGHQIVSISRRAIPSTMNSGSHAISWVKSDLLEHDSILEILPHEQPFDVYVHAVGLLFDSSSGLLGLNKFASGSGSIPSTTATYDEMTKQTAYKLIDYALYQHVNASSVPSVLFISAAEAGWKFTCPVDFLERYLIAKRAVESRLNALSQSKTVRSVIFRPSLIWTWSRPQAIFSVLPFYIGNSLLEGLGVHGVVDRPVKVEYLAGAMLHASENNEISGLMQYKDIDRLAQSSL